MSTNISDQVVEDLLLRWEESFQTGMELSPEELCREHPELFGELRKGITALKQTQSLFDAALDPTVSLPILDGRNASLAMDVHKFVEDVVDGELADFKTIPW